MEYKLFHARARQKQNRAEQIVTYRKPPSALCCGAAGSNIDQDLKARFEYEIRSAARQRWVRGGNLEDIRS